MKNDQESRDKITVGQIREHYSRVLESQIDTLGKLIRKGYHSRHEAESFLSGAIGETLTNIDNINSQAGLVVLFPAPTPTAANAAGE